MKKNIYLLAVAILLFLGGNVLAAIGFRSTSLMSLIQPSLYLLLLCLILKILLKNSTADKKYSFILLYVYLINVGLHIINQDSGFFLFPTNTILLPFLWVYLFDESSESLKSTVFKLLIAFFIINSMWALFERAFVVNVFPPLASSGWNEEDKLEGFRASALQGSPLTNALCLTVIYTFILISKIKFKYKTYLFILGYMAILCFNTRTSMILWPILFMVNYLYEMKHNIVKSKVLSLLVIIVAIFGLFYFVETAGVGDRLFHGGTLFDESGDVRVRTWEMFMEQDFMKLLFGIGMDSNEIEFMMYNFDVAVIENSWVVYILTIGGLLTILLIYGYYNVFKRILCDYSFYQKTFCIGTFLLLGSTNNGLKEIPISVFLLCCFSMPVLLNKNIIKV